MSKTLTLFMVALCSTFSFGQYWHWAQNISCTDNSDVKSQIVDSVGNIYVFGDYNATITFNGNVNKSSVGGKDLFVAKYNAGGAFEWAMSFGGSLNENATHVCADAQHEYIYLTGSFQGTATFGTTVLTSNGGDDIFVVKISQSGTLIWAKKVGYGTANARSNVLDFNKQGDLILTGFFSGTNQFGSFGSLTATSGSDLFVARLDTSANFLNLKQFVTNDLTGTSARLMDFCATDNGFCLGGYFKDAITFNSTSLTGKGGLDFFVVKLTNDLDLVWYKHEGGTGDNYFYDLGTDKEGDVYLVGGTAGPLQYGSNYKNSSTTNVIIVKYDKDGTLKWVRYIDGGLTDQGFSIASNDTLIMVTLWFQNTVTFNKKQYTSSGLYDLLIAVYDEFGNELRAIKASGDNEEKPIALSMRHGRTLVSGTYKSNNMTLGNYVLTNGTTTAKRNIFLACYDEMKITSTSTAATCYRDSTGSATITSVTRGQAPYTYLWMNGATTANAPFVHGGINYVTITDANGVKIVDSVDVWQPSQIKNVAALSHIPCNSMMNGSIQLSTTGGLPFYSYAWTTGATSPSLSNLNVGNYTVTTTDGVGCKAIHYYQITQPNELNLNPDVRNVTCKGGIEGRVRLYPTGGTTPFAYNWNNGNTTFQIYDRPAGTYTVTVTDKNNCNKYQTFVITQPLQYTITGVRSHVSCNGLSDGAVLVSVTGSTPAYSYLWSNNATLKNLSGVPLGTYTLTVTDSRGCMGSQSFIINQPPVLTVNANGKKVCYGKTGLISTSVTGGTVPYVYLWSNIKTTSTISQGVGIYTVTVTDGKNCKAQDSAAITEYPVLEIDLGQDITTSRPDTVVLNPGSGFGAYLWSDATTLPIYQVTSHGLYAVTVTDINGCTASDEIVIDQLTGVMSAMDDVVIYPNPVNDLLCIVNHTAVVNNVVLIDMSGRVCYSNNLLENSILKIPVAALENGIYLLKTETRNGSVCKKVHVIR